jgi:hypothetical protein
MEPHQIPLPPMGRPVRRRRQIPLRKPRLRFPGPEGQGRDLAGGNGDHAEAGSRRCKIRGVNGLTKFNIKSAIFVLTNL